MSKEVKELKDEVKFHKRRADKLEDALWNLIQEVIVESRSSGVGASLQAAQIEATNTMAYLKEKDVERQQSQEDYEQNEKPNVD